LVFFCASRGSGPAISAQEKAIAAKPFHFSSLGLSSEGQPMDYVIVFATASLVLLYALFLKFSLPK